VEALFGDEPETGSGDCTDVMGEPLTEGDAWMPGFAISAHLGGWGKRPRCPSRLLTNHNEYSAAHRFSRARTYDPTRRCYAYNARRCATSGQRKGSLPRSPTLLRYRMMTR
jgi:hypothetical protein